MHGLARTSVDDPENQHHDHAGNITAQLAYAARPGSRWRYPALQHAWRETLPEGGPRIVGTPASQWSSPLTARARAVPISLGVPTSPRHASPRILTYRYTSRIQAAEMPPQPPLLRPLEPLIPFPENSENTLARALSDAAPVHPPSTLEQMVASPLGLQSCPGTRCRPGRAAGCGTWAVAEGLPCFYLEVSPSWYGGYLGAYTTHSHYTIG